MIIPTKAGYDRWSDVYDDDRNPLVLLEEPYVESLLGTVAGRAVLDVGCGTGRHALRLARVGATVTAIDFSAGMLARARAKPGAERVNFLEHDLREPLPLPSASFDVVLSALVLDHIADLPAFFTELRRLCRGDGSVVVSVMHPALMLRGVQARFHDPSTGDEVRPESVPNQISDYVMGALAAGLRLQHLSEHPADEALVSRTPRAARYLGWPMLFLMKMAAQSSPSNPTRRLR
jgi:ubiquinone/menaquinone biosynthesis C-methylase UbiE